MDKNEWKDEARIVEEAWMEEKEAAPRRSWAFWKKAAAGMLALLLCFSSGAAGALLVEAKADAGEQTAAAAVESPIRHVNYGTEAGEALSARQIYQLAQAQAVGVNSSFDSINVFGQHSPAAVSGSGFVIREDGYILTNYHVVEYAVTRDASLSVLFADGSEYPAELVGYYEDNDIAVLKIDADGLSAVTLGDSDTMLVGDTVYCVGNPLGELEFTMSSGIVSALDREIDVDAETRIDMFQVDAAVNAGNSGGPVYGENGEVLGIVTAKYKQSGVEGLGFAIPINDAVRIADALIEDGAMNDQAFLGISARSVDSSVTQNYGIPAGAYVEAVQEGSSAAKAGLQSGDIITALNGEAVDGLSALKRLLRQHQAGDSVVLRIYRAGQEKDLVARLDERPAEEAAAEPETDERAEGRGQYPFPGGLEDWFRDDFGSW